MINIDRYLPEMVPLAKAPALFGLSRSGLYRLAAVGRVRMVKIGSRTLVDAHSVRHFLSTLPEAKIRRDAYCGDYYSTPCNSELK